MRRAPRLVAATALGTASTAAVVVLLSGAAQAQAPDTVAWWSAANAGSGAAAPAPPDVPDGALLVQGSNALQAAPTTPVTNAPASSQAVAGLTFQLPPQSAVGALTLHIHGSAPTGVSIVACRATQSFAAEDNGAWADVPPSDCSQTAPATVSGSQLVFADVSKLVRNGQLSVVLLPGGLDRVVLDRPGADALSVTAAGALGSSAPAFGSGAGSGVGGPSGPSGSSGAAPPVAAVGGSAVLPPATGAAQAVAPPVVAPSPAGAVTGATTAGATSATGSGGLSTTQRRVLAGVVIAAELLGFLLLLSDRDVEERAMGTAAAGAAGGRLRPPDRFARTRSATRAVGGVGRFRAERVGSPPPL